MQVKWFNIHKVNSHQMTRENGQEPTSKLSFQANKYSSPSKDFFLLQVSRNKTCISSLLNCF